MLFRSGLVTFDLDNFPKIERKTAPPKKKEKLEKASPDTGKPVKQEKKVSSGVAPPPAETAAAPPKKEKKPKETKEKPSTDTKKAPAAEESGEPVPSMVDLRVGHIVDSEHLP